MLNVKIQHHGCPGDWLCMTAACHSMWKSHSYLRFRLDACCPEIFKNAPWEYTHDQHDLTLKIDYGWARTECDRRDLRFVPSFFTDLQKLLNLPAKMEVWGPQIFFSKEELDKPPLIKEPYCVICSGWKQDYPIKNWGIDNWQAVVDWIRSRLDVQVVQIGEHNPPWHVHKPLQGAVSLVGKTNTRDLYLLAYHSKFGLGHESYLHHIYASDFHSQERGLTHAKPFVCVASGWNPGKWCSYNTEVYITRQGQLDCCRPGGCNKANIGSCLKPSIVGDEKVGKCMSMIRVEEVTNAIEDYVNGGTVPLILKPEKSREIAML